MAHTIVPGYDFAIDEVPTYNKFRLAASRLQINDLDFNDVNTSIRIILNAQESGGSGATMAAEGWMWYDPNGDLYIRQRWTDEDFGMTGHTEAQSITPLVRTLGGWASTRVPFEGGVNNEGGRPLYMDVLSADDVKEYSLPNVYFLAGWVTYHVDSTPFVGYGPDTMASGTRPYFVGRGAVRQWIGTFPASESAPHRMISFNGTQYASTDMNHVGSLDYKRWSGELYGAHPSATLGGSSNSNWPMKWVYSKAMHGHYSAL